MGKLGEIGKSIKELSNGIRNKKRELKDKILAQEKRINEALDPSDYPD